MIVTEVLFTLHDKRVVIMKTMVVPFGTGIARGVTQGSILDAFFILYSFVFTVLTIESF